MTPTEKGETVTNDRGFFTIDTDDTHGGTMTVAELATRDQAQAKEREFERKAIRAGLAIIGVFCIIGGYAIMAAAGWVPAMPWSPVGQAQIEQHQEAPINLNDFDIPEGYEPAVPVAPAESGRWT